MIDDLLVQIVYVINIEEERYDIRSVYENIRDICFDILSYEKNFDWITRKSGKKALKGLGQLDKSLAVYISYHDIDQAIGYISSCQVVSKIIAVMKDLSDGKYQNNILYDYLISKLGFNEDEVKKWEEE